MELSLTDATILIIDDEPINILLLSRVLTRAGYSRIWSSTDSRETFGLYDTCTPDLILIDLHMPYRDGLSIIEELRERVPPETFPPIMMLTADTNPEIEKRALRAGAKDFVNKPFNPTRLTLRVRNLLESRALYLHVRAQNEGLDEKVRERTEALERAHEDVLNRLALASEFRDYTTGRHTQRVGWLSYLIALRLGFAEADAFVLRLAAPLHDVGKIGIPDIILLKPAALTQQETMLMRSHVTLGATLLSHGQSAALRLAEEIARTHHERFDGSGYPQGLRGDAIPLCGQIVAVADAFDTMTHRRPYKEPWPLDHALAEIRACSGSAYNPRVVEAFLEVIKEGSYIIEKESLEETSRSARKG